MKPPLVSTGEPQADRDLAVLRNVIVQQPPQSPPPEVRERLLQQVKRLRPALFAPPLNLRVWGALLAVWLFIILNWLMPAGPLLRWESEHPMVTAFVVYRQTPNEWTLVGTLPAQAVEYEFTERFYLPLRPAVTYLIVALDVNGQELDRVTATLPAWPTWLSVFALGAFSLSAATFVVNWFHWRDLQRLGA